MFSTCNGGNVTTGSHKQCSCNETLQQQARWWMWAMRSVKLSQNCPRQITAKHKSWVLLSTEHLKIRSIRVCVVVCELNCICAEQLREKWLKRRWLKDKVINRRDSTFKLSVSRRYGACEDSFSFNFLVLPNGVFFLPLVFSSHAFWQVWSHFFFL